MCKNLFDVLQHDCSGCGICAGACPVNALNMEITKDGFYRPVKNEKCIDCGLCTKVCPFVNEQKRSGIFKNDKVFGKYEGVYAVYSKNKDIRYNSSTAGFIRTLLCSSLGRYDGVIVLTETKEPLKPEVKLLNEVQDIAGKMCKSKYFATELSEAVKILKKTKGKFIIVGLPCQIAGLKNANKFLKRDILTIDLFCGAVYSLNFMEKYFKLKGISPSKIDFRDKSSGWHNISLSLQDNEILCRNGTISRKEIKTKANDDEFYYAQRNKFCTQDACLKCKYCYQGAADIQVGDFWGNKYQNDEEGVNLVVTRTLKGDRLVKSCSKDLEIKRHKIKQVHQSQPWFILADNRIKLFRGEKVRSNPVSKFDTVHAKLILNRAMQNYVNRSKNISELREFYEIYKTDFENDNLKVINNFGGGAFLVFPSDSASLGSFGDQAMMSSLLSHIYTSFPSAEIAYFSLWNNEYYNDYKAQYGYDIPLLKNSPEYSSCNLIERFKIQALNYDTLIVIGADILDGGCGIQQALAYYSVMMEAVAMGMRVIVTGFSFNKRNYPEIIDAVVKLSEAGAILNVRDECSFERLRDIGCKNLIQTADMAFLFDETKYQKSDFAVSLKKRLEDLKANGKKVIGVHLTATKKDYKKFIPRVADALDNCKDDIILLLPHDYRVYDQALSDEFMCNEVQIELEKRGHNVINAYNLRNEADVKYIIDLCNVLLTSRMHIAIAAFSKGVPVVSFVYQNKFEGLYRFYNIDKNLMFEKDDFDVEALNDAIIYLLDNDFSTIINEKNKEIRVLSSKNFDFLKEKVLLE